jgi:activator of HSP90 ATPase
MSAPNRRSRFLGLFGRHDHSQESITTLNTAATSATTSTAGASAAASATVAIVSGSENSAAMLRNMQNASQELNKHIADMANKGECDHRSLDVNRSRGEE